MNDLALSSIELCAGVGMLGEGVRAALDFLGIGHRTVCYVEREAPAAAQLAALMEAGALDPAPVWSDLVTFRGGDWRGKVDCVIAGFPCQDISIAGRRAGLDGKRSGLFFNILDIADACGAWCIALENVSAIATATASVVDEEEGELDERAAARVVGELADRGWDAEWITLSASDVGASHGRARWFCFAWRRLADTGCGDARRIEPQRDDVAHAGSQGLPQRAGGGKDDGALQPSEWAEPAGIHRTLPLFAPGPADPLWRDILAGSVGGGWARTVSDDEAGACPWAPATQPGVRMLVNGLALVVDESRNHQLRQVGNGVVPLQAAVAFVVLARRAGVLT